MPQFPSEEWMDAFCVELAEHPRAGEIAPALDGVYRFVVEPAGPLTQTQRYDVEIRPDENGGARVAQLDAPHPSPRLELRADYERWRQLVTRKLDVGMAIMLRRLKVSGDIMALRRDVSSATPLMDALSSVDSQWL